MSSQSAMSWTIVAWWRILCRIICFGSRALTRWRLSLPILLTAASKTPLNSLSGWRSSHSNLLLFSSELSQEVEVITTDSQSAILSWCRDPIWCTWPDFFYLSDDCGFLDMEHHLWREDRSVIYSYNCFWALPKQGWSPAELTAIFYCLIWDSPNLEGQVPRIYIPQKQGGPIISPGTGFPFWRLLRPASTRVSELSQEDSYLYSLSTDSPENIVSLWRFTVT
jgi:hypothetical protein